MTYWWGGGLRACGCSIIFLTQCWYIISFRMSAFGCAWWSTAVLVAGLPSKPATFPTPSGLCVSAWWVSMLGSLFWLEIDLYFTDAYTIKYEHVLPTQRKGLILLFQSQVQKASDIIYNEGLNMYNLYDNCPHTTAGNFSRHEADLSNIMRNHHFHKTMLFRAKSKWVSFEHLVQSL